MSIPKQICALPDELVNTIATFCELGTLRPTCSWLSLMPSMHSRTLSGLQKTLDSSRVRGHCYAHYAALILRRRAALVTSLHFSIAGRFLLQWTSHALIAPLAWVLISSSSKMSSIAVLLRCLVVGLTYSFLLREMQEMQLLSALLDYQRHSSDERMLRVLRLLVKVPIRHFSRIVNTNNDAEVRELNMLRAHGQHSLNSVAPLNDIPVAVFDKFLCTKAVQMMPDSFIWLANVDFPGSPYEELRRMLETARAGHGPPELTCNFRWLVWRLGCLVHSSSRTKSNICTAAYMKGACGTTNASSLSILVSKTH